MSSDSSSNVIDLWISVPCSFAILLVVSLAYKLIKSNNGRNAKIHALYWAIAVPTIIILPEDVATYIFTELTITLVGAVYPIYRAGKFTMMYRLWYYILCVHLLLCYFLDVLNSQGVLYTIRR